MSSTGTLPEAGPRSARTAELGVELGAEAAGAAALHWRALEGLYRSAPVNALFRSSLEILGEGQTRITFEIDESCFHAAGAAHGTVYFKMLDDAAFYAANTLITDRFLLTTAFNLHFSKPVREGRIVAEGLWISGRRRVLVAESRLLDAEGEEVGRGTGTFMRSRIALSSIPGYATIAAAG
ncbi:MAG: PaaI family thioesterase [Novosphingobium sp.]